MTNPKPNMVKKVKVEAYRGVRNDADCLDCNAGWDIQGEDTLNDIRSHVRATGHEVARTYGSEFRYKLEENL